MRCFTILIACGWLLLAPPIEKVETTERDIRRPLKQWIFSDGFDTAKECYRRKVEYAAAASVVDDKLSNNIWSLAKCVPSDAIGFKLK